jgi:hypothetical protein
MPFFEIFSPTKPVKPTDEVITITLPCTWSEQGLRSADGQFFGIPDIPDSHDTEEQVQFICLWAKKSYDPEKRSTLLRAMNGTLILSAEHATLPRVCFEDYTNESEEPDEPDAESAAVEYKRPTATTSVRHLFNGEPELPEDGESLYVSNYKKKNAEDMLEKWTNHYGNGRPFNEMKYRDFKKSMDHFFGATRSGLRFDLWDYITLHYLFHNHKKLEDDEIAYIRYRRNDISSRITTGLKVIQPKQKQAKRQRTSG